MSTFAESQWSTAEGAHAYRDQADRIIPERAILLEVLASFYGHFLGVGSGKRVLDLGCGDGLLGETLLRQEAGLDLVLVDGSPDMLKAARVRLAERPVREFCQATFEEIINGQASWYHYDLVVSSFAIHHLEPLQRKALFARIFGMLRPGRYFLNIDVVLPQRTAYADWYFDLWREWIQRLEKSQGLTDSLTQVPAQARVRPENHYDLLEHQLADLRDVGFSEVECHFRYGLFGLYGGRKPTTV